MKRLSALPLALVAAASALACTSALVGAGRSSTGRALLWKHRDTSCLHNYVARVDRPGCLPYIALFNAPDTAMAEAWVGVNSAGFAVMNTASYNLVPDTAVLRDREGLVMSRALGLCTSVEQFDSLLRALPRPLGVQANFGAIDSTGAGAVFETCDTGFVRFDLRPDSMLLRTNFSLSGTCGPGKGLERYQAECALLTPRPVIAPLTLTDTVSTSFWPLTCRTAPADDHGQYIPRRSTSASVVISGTTMWVRPGYPVRPGARTHRATLDSIPPALRADSKEWPR